MVNGEIHVKKSISCHSNCLPSEPRCDGDLAARLQTKQETKGNHQPKPLSQNSKPAMPCGIVLGYSALKPPKRFNNENPGEAPEHPPKANTGIPSMDTFFGGFTCSISHEQSSKHILTTQAGCCSKQISNTVRSIPKPALIYCFLCMKGPWLPTLSILVFSEPQHYWAATVFWQYDSWLRKLDMHIPPLYPTKQKTPCRCHASWILNHLLLMMMFMTQR